MDARTELRVRLLATMRTLREATTGDVARAAGIAPRTAVSYLRGLREAGALRSSTVQRVTIWEVCDG